MQVVRILGFDVSSSTIGWALLVVEWAGNYYKISLSDAGFIKPIKDGSIIERLASTRTEIKTLIERLQPTHIAIEEIVQFMAGGSTAKTIITLTAFNRMVGLVAHDYLVQYKETPKFFSVMSIRHGLKTGKKLPKKEDIPKLVCKQLNAKLNPILNKVGKVKPETYDRADAIAVALYYAYKLTGRLSNE